MTYRGQIAQGQIILSQPIQLPEGTAVDVAVTPLDARIARPRERKKLRQISPLRLPGPSLADELVRDRR